MIECPFCQNEIESHSQICPYCKHELPERSDEGDYDSEVDNVRQSEAFNEMSVVEIISSKFKCSKCKCEECNVKEVAMSGTGLSKLFDIEHNHFLFVSCMNCGFVEIYDPDVLSGHKTGKLGTVMDILFGG